MVLITQVLCFAKKGSRPVRKYLKSGFLDTLRFHVKGGSGGAGLPQYGGVGGRGGDVVIVATDGLTLRDLIHKYPSKSVSANPGYESTKRGILGQPGENLEFKVPCGVRAFNQTGALIGEVDKPHSKLVVAKGGIGGCKETGFSGLKGQNHPITLDLKLIADLALVGFPNSGKSTLIRCVTNAKPKIAAYPFTTLRPNLGIINYPDLRTISIADLPGLIEGAHDNVGMGHKFLKHVDRTKLLIYIVDIQGFRLSSHYQSRKCLETVILLNREMELYNPDYLERKAILIVNKMDTDNAEKRFNEIKPALYNIGSVLGDFPAAIRPEKPVKFDEVITTSLILKNPDEIAMLKKKFRFYLDKVAEEELESQKEDVTEVEVFKQLKQELRIHSPTVL